MPWPAELLLIAVSLSMDAFAISVTNGIVINEVRPRHAIKTGLFFGFFQAAMPFLGYILGSTVSDYIKAYDHWIAFVLLGFIGGKMIVESIKERRKSSEAEPEAGRDPTKTGNLLWLAIATSIDALAVGISLALLDVPVISSCVVIGVVTFLLSFTGVILGKKIGRVFRSWAEIAGGSVLILIGLKILLEHLVKGA